MITSIFSKSKPINFLSVLVITLVAFSIAKLKLVNITYSSSKILETIFQFIILYLSILIVDFITNKNSLTQKNDFEILIYSLLLLLIPQSLSNYKIIFANFFVLLALRRIISLRSGKSTKKKLFDAALLITIASLFNGYTLLFFALIYAKLFLYRDNELNHWLIPFIGLGTVFILGVSYSILMYGELTSVLPLAFDFNLDFTAYNATKIIIALSFLLVLSILGIFYYVKGINLHLKSLRPSFIIILVACIISIIIIIFATPKTGGELLYVFAPLSIIISNFLDRIKKPWLKETVLGFLFLLPIVLLLL